MIPRMLAILVILVGLSAISASKYPVSQTSAQSRPNFVVVLVDDLDSESISRMPAVNRHLAAAGASFSRFFATTPLCCPSRASILRGQYAHNHRVLRNTGDDAGFAAFNATGHEADTMATALQAGSYQTALIGKYLNGYAYPRSDTTYIPPGWNYWVAGVDHDAYNNFNYDLNVNGEVVHHGDDARDYMTDVLTTHALEFLDTRAGSAQPFFLYLAPYAPHSPSTPAPRHEGMFSGETAPRGPAFNERNIQDKPQWVQTSRLTEERVSRIDDGYQDRLESLMAVDEMVDVVVQRLDQQGVLSSTYILFLSDNGYFLGEHRQPHGKDAPYDAASRVPMIVRGPGIEAGSTIEEIGLNIDIFPTVAELAGISTPSFVDGRSMVPLLSGNNAGWRQLALIEGFGKETESNEESETSTPPFIALRAKDFLYAEYETGERELYDLRKDPHQISNIARETPNSLLREYSHRLDSLSSCAGRDCVHWEDQPISGHSADNSRKDGGKDKGRGKDKEKDDEKGNSRGNGPHRDKDNHGKQRNRLREQVLRQEARATPSNERERRVTVGGHSDAIAYFRLDVPPRGTVQGPLSLRVHVASVAAAGDLVVVLDTPGAPPGTTSPGGHERLGSAAIDDMGWVTVDISSYAANAAELTFILRGREGGEFSVSGGGSRNPPQLASESTPVEFSRRERERHSRT